jgi:hypothetical protein
MPQKTRWQISPSLPFDVLCLLNPLTEDEFYRQFHRETVTHFTPLLTDSARQALADLKRIIKDEGQHIISALLCLYFSAVEVQTLDDMLKVVTDSSTMQANLTRTPYYDETEWALYEAARPALTTIFTFLKTIDFQAYWHSHSLPRIQAKIAAIEPLLPGYDVVDIVERCLGFSLPSPTITIYLLDFTKPHGIKITGSRFINQVDVDFKIVLRTAVHEMMHPPFQMDAELGAALDRLRQDAFLMDKVLNHNPDYGYNSFEGYIEEDCVQALDQLINEHFQVAPDPLKRWQMSDEGMHVLAFVLYKKLKQERLLTGGENFRTVLLRLLNTGQLDNIQSLYEQESAAHIPAS